MRQSDAENIWKLTSGTEYEKWRERKLAQFVQDSAPIAPVVIKNLANPSQNERAEILRRCETSNSAVYACETDNSDPLAVRSELVSFSAAMGLEVAEKHRSAEQDGIVALQQSTSESKRGYLPYSKRAMNWHTDGYYNGPAQKIRAMVLHCARPAADGGSNQFLDPEIAYIRLRDENPAYIEALMHASAMTIPENREADGQLRPASVGPVFSVNSMTGHLEMRYTSRTRSIEWRDDIETRSAVDFLNDLLQTGDPFMQSIKLKSGQGVLCNNSLHNRSRFDPTLAEDSDRLIFRIRFLNRIARS